MTSEQYERGRAVFRNSGADEDFGTDSEVLSPDPTTSGAGTTHYPLSGTDEGGAAANGAKEAAGHAVEKAGDVAGSAAGKAGDLAGSAAEKAGDLAGSAAEKAAELKDVALERGGDVAAVAKDELARLAQEARTEVQSLWSNASEQLKGQAATGQQQLSELLHSLAGELGEMASKSENTGPLTALARQGAARGGELSRWLADSEPGDVLTQLRRFARRRPFVFLASAAVAGVVVGRLGRGLMAASDHADSAPARLADDSTRSVTATSGVTSPLPVSYEEVPSFGVGEAPEHVGSYATQPTVNDPYGVAGGAR